MPRGCAQDILRETRCHMPFRQTIAAKIFGLAIILLLLTIALAGFLLYEVTRTKQDLTVVANFDVPLTQSLARLDEFGLRRRLAFERWFGALNASEPNREIVAEAGEIRRDQQLQLPVALRELLVRAHERRAFRVRPIERQHRLVELHPRRPSGRQRRQRLCNLFQPLRIPSPT